MVSINLTVEACKYILGTFQITSTTEECTPRCATQFKTPATLFSNSVLVALSLERPRK